MIHFVKHIAWSVCFRHEDHLFQTGLIESGFCSRCTALYTGIGLTISCILAMKRWTRTELPISIVLLWIVGWLSLLGLDAFADHLINYNASFYTRIISGMFAGVGIPLFLVPVLASYSRSKRMNPEKIVNVRETVWLYMAGSIHILLMLLAIHQDNVFGASIIVYFIVMSILGLVSLVYTVMLLVLNMLFTSVGKWGGVTAGIGTVIVLVGLYGLHVVFQGKPF